MQHSPEDIKRRLLACIDEDCNVRDTATCLAVVGDLEQTEITKKILEETRLGKTVNDIRRKAQNPELSKRLKILVKKWREFFKSDQANGAPVHAHNGRQSPALSVPSLQRIRRGNSPCSIASSGNASPIGFLSAPTTPSSICHRTRVPSPPITTARNNKPNSPLLTTKKNVDNVARNFASNKRLRKEGAEVEVPPSKRAKHNAVNGGFDDECSRDSVASAVSNDRVSRTSHEGVPSQPDTPIRRSRRRRTQDGLTPQSSVDPLKQLMSKQTKVKTTSQLLAELAEKKGDKKLAKRANILQQARDQDRSYRDNERNNKMAHIQRFLKSDPVIDEINLVDDDDDDELRSISRSSAPSIEIIEVKTKEDAAVVRPHSPISNMDLLGIKETESPEDILSRLPALNLDHLSLEDSPHRESSSDASDSESESQEKLVRKAHKIDKHKIQQLNSVNIDGQNGNFDMDSRFREWHEVVTNRSYQDTPLVLLPYVLTQF